MEQRKKRSSPAALRRQQQIVDCLYEKLRHTPYHTLSVSDLCRQVGISRKAFYNYYPDKEACLCALLDQILQESILHVTTSLPESDPSLNAAILYLDFWKGQKELFDILLRDSLFYLLILRYMEYVLREEHTLLDLLNTPEVRSDRDILACYVSSQVALLLQWYIRGFDTPTEEMARKLLRVIHAPMLPQNEM